MSVCIPRRFWRVHTRRLPNHAYGSYHAQNGTGYLLHKENVGTGRSLLHNLILDEATKKDCVRSTRRMPINLNLLTFYLIVLLAPFEYILDILGGSSSSPSPSVALEVALLGVVFTYLGQGQPRKIWRLSTRFLVIVWFALCAIFILFYTVTQGIFSSLSSASVEELLLLLAGALLIRALWQVSTRYRDLLAFLGATLFPWMFMMTSVDLMVEAIYHLPYVYDPVLYRIDTILALGWVTVFADALKQHVVLGRVVIFNYYYIAFWECWRRYRNA